MTRPCAECLHRWDELADYNGRIAKGIVHNAEYTTRMLTLQRQYDREHDADYLSRLNTELGCASAPRREPRSYALLLLVCLSIVGAVLILAIIGLFIQALT